MPIFPSASGYTGIEATPLARVDYSDHILSRVYENDWLPRITASELLNLRPDVTRPSSSCMPLKWARCVRTRRTSSSCPTLSARRRVV